MRVTGRYQDVSTTGERVRAFVPFPLPPKDPPFALDDRTRVLQVEALAALKRLAIAGATVPSADWFLYGFARKEAVISSQIEGTQATLVDVLSAEAAPESAPTDDVREVCNYVGALAYARRQLALRKGIPLGVRLICEVHKRLMSGTRGAAKLPGRIRRTQNWVGGARPSQASFIPPPAGELPAALSALEKWIHGDDPLPPLIRAGLAHVQFETLHPFLDGNGRVGRLLVTLLLEHWKLLDGPLLYLSLAIKRRQREYYDRLSDVRTKGDWENWTHYFLECVREAADDGVGLAQRLFAIIGRDRQTLLDHRGATLPAVQLLDRLPLHPIVTVARAIKLLHTTKPTAAKALAVLQSAGILRETTGRSRDRVYSYERYLRVLTNE